MARGGRRAGKPGAAYANRVDLNARPLPVTTAPGQAYGEAGQQAASQAAVPMANGDLNTLGPSPQDVMGQAQSYTPPDVVPLRAPTTNPAEPLMTPPPPQPAVGSDLLSAVALLNSLGDDASPAVKALRKAVGAAQANAAAP